MGRGYMYAGLWLSLIHDHNEDDEDMAYERHYVCVGVGLLLARWIIVKIFCLSILDDDVCMEYGIHSVCGMSNVV